MRNLIKSMTVELADGTSVTYEGSDGYVIERNLGPGTREAFAHLVLPIEAVDEPA